MTDQNNALALELERLSRQSGADTLMMYGEPEVGLFSQPFFGEPLKGNMRPLGDWRGADAELVIALWNNLPTILSALRTPAPAPVAVGGDVTQADRDAAAKWAKRNSRHHQAANITRGSCDDAPLVQAFAEHRIAALQAQPAPAQGDDVERVAKAVHEFLCRRDIMQYLDNDEDCEGIARAALAAMQQQDPVADEDIPPPDLQRCLNERDDFLVSRDLWGDFTDWLAVKYPDRERCVQQDPVEDDVRELVGALKPFADVADEYDDSEDDNFEVWMDAGPERTIRASFALKHYRAARTILKRLSTQPKPDAAVAEDQWQPIETAPNDGTQILVEVMKGYFAVVSYWDGGWRESANGMMLRNPPLRWAAIRAGGQPS